MTKHSFLSKEKKQVILQVYHYLEEESKKGPRFKQDKGHFRYSTKYSPENNKRASQD